MLSIGKMPISISEKFLISVSVPRGAGLTPNLPVFLSAHPPICLLRNYLSKCLQIPAQKISNQISGEQKARPSGIREWKCIHLSRAAMNVFQDTKACSWDHQHTVEFPFYVYLPSNFLPLLKISFASTDIFSQK